MDTVLLDTILISGFIHRDSIFVWRRRFSGEILFMTIDDEFFSNISIWQWLPKPKEEWPFLISRFTKPLLCQALMTSSQANKVLSFVKSRFTNFIVCLNGCPYVSLIFYLCERLPQTFRAIFELEWRIVIDSFSTLICLRSLDIWQSHVRMKFDRIHLPKVI